jgi:DNA anti-recombination protein RmuC
MYSAKALSRIENIEKKIGFIQEIVDEIKERIPVILEAVKRIKKGQQAR